MFHEILAPLDGSSPAELALGHAAAVARATGGRIHLLRVIRPGRAGGLRHDAVEWRMDRTEALDYVRDRAERLAPRAGEVRCEVSEGRAEEEIVAYARREDVDLIVLTTHGESEPTRFELGSTAQKVVQGAGTSILLVRPEADSGRRAFDEDYRRVLVPVDGSSRGEWAVCTAATLLGDAAEAEMILTHVIPVPEMVARMRTDEEIESLRGRIVEASHRAAERYLTDLCRSIERAGLSLDRRILVSPRVTATIQQEADAGDVDLVVISAHGASGEAPWPYGSVASHMIRYGRNPLLVLQDEPAAVSPPESGDARPERVRER